MGFLSTQIENATNMTEMLAILEHGKSATNQNPAKIRVCWLGKRISVAGYWFGVSPLFIVEHIFRRAEYFKFEFTPKERAAGAKVMQILESLEKDAEALEKQACCITKIFYCISCCYIDCMYGRNYHKWNDGAYGDPIFDTYTRAQYIETFKKQPPKDIHFSDEYPQRWRAAQNQGEI